VPDQRHHRGPHPEDHILFAPEAVPALRSAVADLSWLLTRNYASPGAIKLVGDRYNLTQRQRTAVMRCACSDASLEYRLTRQIPSSQMPTPLLLIDGYNVLTTIEAALAGGALFIAHDGCLRDMASIHGTYRKVEETLPALQLAGHVLSRLGIPRCVWYLDSPVSNSGRLKAAILDIAAQHRWDWPVEVVNNPDPLLAASDEVIATADSAVLDRCARWFNLARFIVLAAVPQPRIIDLS